MKKLCASLVALMMMGVTTTASAQAAFAESTSDIYRIGIQLGGNIPTFSEGEFGATLGWNMGVTALYNTESFIPNSYLSGSFLYTRKGATSDPYNFTDANGKVLQTLNDATYRLHYTEIPIRFGYAYEVNSELCIMAETGPYFGMRWTAHLKADEYIVNGTSTEPKPYDGDMKDLYKDLRRFDCGWGIHTGVFMAGKYRIMLGYDWGVCDVVPEMTGNNQNLSLSLSVFLD